MAVCLFYFLLPPRLNFPGRFVKFLQSVGYVYGVFICYYYFISVGEGGMKYCCQGQSDGGVLSGARGFPGPLPSSDADRLCDLKGVLLTFEEQQDVLCCL